MARLLYAWELGAALGHVGAFMPLAKALRGRGHTVHWAVAQPGMTGEFIAREGFGVLPAPNPIELQRPGVPLTYADILLRFGFDRVSMLFGNVAAWRELLLLTDTQLMLADHAPTALLAARTLGIPVMMFSNGFTLPPHQNPLPNMRPWNHVPVEQVAALDNEASATINAVLARFGKPPLTSTAQLFDVAEQTLMTFPELDHYTDRGDARYWGSLPSAGTGTAVAWPQVPGPKLFAYLRRQTVHHVAMLEALLRFPGPCAVYFPDLPAALRRRFAAPHLLFLDQPADIAQMARDADLAVTYASVATTTAFLLAGKPLLLLPGHLEQFLLARRVAKLGAGIVVVPEKPAEKLLDTLLKLVESPDYVRAAQAFSARYAAFDQVRVAENLVRRIEELATP